MTAMVTIMNCSRLFVCIAYLKRFVFRAIIFVADQALWSVSSRTMSHRHVLYEIYLKPVRRILFSLNSEIKTLLASEIVQSQDMEQRPWRSSIMIPIKWWLRTVKIDEKLLRLNLQRLVGMNHSHCVPQDWVSAQGVSTPFKLQPNILRTYEKVRNQLLIGWRDCFFRLAPSLYSYIQILPHFLLNSLLSFHMSGRSYIRMRESTLGFHHK